MEKAREQVEVVVVGGGPAGATLASVVAMRGNRVLLLEKEHFPRYQIGESLLPSTVHGICHLLGVTEDLANAGFVRKRGGTFRWGANPDPWTFSFSLSSRVSDGTSYAYQVERSRFDEILLDNAVRKGVDVRQGCPAVEVLDDGDRVAGVRYTDREGHVHEVAAQYVADASGSGSRLYGHVGGSRVQSSFFRGLALFGYFENGKRLPPPDAGNILTVAFDRGWFWYIPLTDTLTSVGAVVRREEAAQIRGDPAAALARLVRECPTIEECLADATRVTTGQYGKVRVRRDYSYRNTAFWGRGMVLVGDAACFVDPVFSSGVHLATYGALLAGRSINSVLSGTVDEETAFREFESRYRREYSVFYEFLMSFYHMHADEQSYFWSAKKVTDSHRSELESFVELVSGLATTGFELASGDDAAARFRDRADEFASAVDTMVVRGGHTATPLFKSSLIREAMREGSRVQRRTPHGADTGTERPLLTDGLVPSEDGMSWSRPTAA